MSSRSLWSNNHTSGILPFLVAGSCSKYLKSSPRSAPPDFSTCMPKGTFDTLTISFLRSATVSPFSHSISKDRRPAWLTHRRPPPFSCTMIALASWVSEAFKPAASACFTASSSSSMSRDVMAFFKASTAASSLSSCSFRISPSLFFLLALARNRSSAGEVGVASSAGASPAAASLTLKRGRPSLSVVVTFPAAALRVAPDLAEPPLRAPAATKPVQPTLFRRIPTRASRPHVVSKAQPARRWKPSPRRRTACAVMALPRRARPAPRVGGLANKRRLVQKARPPPWARA
mmetsp:Transcript_14178/g.37736  ORF Transcript_14178/g.37736 Transcript_14178/m.37736 type:complete len:289 (+) Transcript_14178:542-1408(+)